MLQFFLYSIKLLNFLKFCYWFFGVFIVNFENLKKLVLFAEISQAGKTPNVSFRSQQSTEECLIQFIHQSDSTSLFFLLPMLTCRTFSVTLICVCWTLYRSMYFPVFSWKVQKQLGVPVGRRPTGLSQSLLTAFYWDLVFFQIFLEILSLDFV